MNQRSGVVKRNYDAAVKANPWLTVPAIDKRVNTIMQSDATVTVSRRRLIQIIDAAHLALAPHVACKDGCDHCCHIAVTITQTEAEVIGAATQIKPVQLKPADLDSVDSLRKDIGNYRNVACPFLQHHRCSVYAVRPSACRAHHSLNNDNEQCKMSVPSEESSVPSFNLKTPLFALAHLSLVVKESVGDIRDYFPQGIVNV
jgi:Fe-S-cluster containining protein